MKLIIVAATWLILGPVGLLVVLARVAWRVIR